MQVSLKPRYGPTASEPSFRSLPEDISPDVLRESRSVTDGPVEGIAELPLMPRDALKPCELHAIGAQVESPGPSAAACSGLIGG